MDILLTTQTDTLPTATTEQSLIGYINNRGLRSEVDTKAGLFLGHGHLQGFKPDDEQMPVIQGNISELAILAGIEPYAKHDTVETEDRINDFLEGIQYGLGYKTVEALDLKIKNDEHGTIQRGAAFTFAFITAVTNELEFSRLLGSQTPVAKRCLEDLEFATRGVNDPITINIHDNLVKIGAKSPLNIQ